MNLDPSPSSEVQGLHAALGALFVLLPVAVSLRHPSFTLGYPHLTGSFVGTAFAVVKEFVWDQNIEDPATRGSNLQDFSFYILGIAIANVVLWL